MDADSGVKFGLDDDCDVLRRQC